MEILSDIVMLALIFALILQALSYNVGSSGSYWPDFSKGKGFIESMREELKDEDYVMGGKVIAGILVVIGLISTAVYI